MYNFNCGRFLLKPVGKSQQKKKLFSTHLLDKKVMAEAICEVWATGNSWNLLIEGSIAFNVPSGEALAICTYKWTLSINKDMCSRSYNMESRVTRRDNHHKT